MLIFKICFLSLCHVNQNTKTNEIYKKKTQATAPLT